MFPAVEFQNFLITSLGLYAMIVFRYFIICGIFYYLLWMRKNNFLKLQKDRPDPKIVRSEIRWSLITSVLFTLPGAYMIEAFKVGGTQIYLDPAKYGYFYLMASVFLFMFIHDTYFYWTHVWMHKNPKRFRLLHKVHHQSLNPTPWAAFSFHPYEGLIEAIIIPLLVFVMPIHIGVLAFLLLAMTFFSVVNHSGFEIYPKSWMRSIWGRWMISPTHHNLHHKKFDCNYALYFRFWDKWMGTDLMPDLDDDTSDTSTKGRKIKNKPQVLEPTL